MGFNLPFGLGRKDAHAQEVRDNITYSEAGQPTDPELENANILGRFAPMLKDDIVQYILDHNEIFTPLYAVFSPLNSTAKLSKTDAIVLECRVGVVLEYIGWSMDTEDYEHMGASLLQGMKYYAFCRINEARDGWKGHLLTEQVRRIQTQELKEKRI